MSFKNAYRLLICFHPVVSADGVTDPAILDDAYSGLVYSPTSIITPNVEITAYNREGTTVETRDKKLVTNLKPWVYRETGAITAGNITLSTERPVDQDSPFAALLTNVSVANPLIGVFKVGEFVSADATTRTYKTVFTQPAFLTQCDAFQGAAMEVVTADWQFTSTGMYTKGAVANNQTMTLTTETGAIAWSTTQN